VVLLGYAVEGVGVAVWVFEVDGVVVLVDGAFVDGEGLCVAVFFEGGPVDGDALVGVGSVGCGEGVGGGECGECVPHACLSGGWWGAGQAPTRRGYYSNASSYTSWAVGLRDGSYPPPVGVCPRTCARSPRIVLMSRFFPHAGSDLMR